MNLSKNIKMQSNGNSNYNNNIHRKKKPQKLCRIVLNNFDYMNMT